MEDAQKIPEDDIFAIHISESMGLRNQLRAGLVEAQGKDTGKIPMFVSWPEWLDDGIICMYVSDFQDVLRNAVRDAVFTFCEDDEEPEKAEKTETEPEQFQAMDYGELEKIDVPADTEEDSNLDEDNKVEDEPADTEEDSNLEDVPADTEEDSNVGEGNNTEET